MPPPGVKPAGQGDFRLFTSYRRQRRKLRGVCPQSSRQWPEDLRRQDPDPPGRGVKHPPAEVAPGSGARPEKAVCPRVERGDPGGDPAGPVETVIIVLLGL